MTTECRTVRKVAHALAEQRYSAEERPEALHSQSLLAGEWGRHIGACELAEGSTLKRGACRPSATSEVDLCL